MWSRKPSAKQKFVRHSRITGWVARRFTELLEQREKPNRREVISSFNLRAKNFVWCVEASKRSAAQNKFGGEIWNMPRTSWSQRQRTRCTPCARLFIKYKNRVCVHCLRSSEAFWLGFKNNHLNAWRACYNLDNTFIYQSCRYCVVSIRRHIYILHASGLIFSSCTDCNSTIVHNTA